MAEFYRWDQNPVIYLEPVGRPVTVPYPLRSSLTEVSNRILAIRREHNEAFERDARTDHGASVLLLARSEQRALAQALADTGWTWSLLEAELRRRTTERWAHKIRYGWF